MTTLPELLEKLLTQLPKYFPNEDVIADGVNRVMHFSDPQGNAREGTFCLSLRDTPLLFRDRRTCSEADAKRLRKHIVRAVSEVGKPPLSFANLGFDVLSLFKEVDPQYSHVVHAFENNMWFSMQCVVEFEETTHYVVFSFNTAGIKRPA